MATVLLYEMLRAGDVIAIEPGIEGLEGIGGVRFEDPC
jgi:Xaa-Pro aminopeptidase